MPESRPYVLGDGLLRESKLSVGSDTITARADRLKVAIRFGGGNTKVAERSGVPFSTLSNYLAGRDMKADAMVTLARACGVSLSWLASGDGAMTNDGLELTGQKPDSVALKFFHAEPSAGRGITPDEWEGYDEYELPRHFLAGVFGTWKKDLFLVRVQGDSMQPSINPGDTLLVDYTPDALAQAIYVMNFHGMFIVKRLTIKDRETFTVTSDNARYPSFDVPVEQVAWVRAGEARDLTIIGRVMARFQPNI
ncbi:LexA family transcriptional regulator [Acetobacter sacchari]|uniref:LexA family transcriptional regulator n=1 Tax=Acetobacter sacchari TaxID=2661687 RepID=UPI001FAF7B8D|nr:S24 family peptidase [Acetobacter sacchari]